MYFANGLVIYDPLIFVIFLKGNFLQMSLGLEVIIDFGFTKFGFCVRAQIFPYLADFCFPNFGSRVSLIFLWGIWFI